MNVSMDIIADGTVDLTQRGEQAEDGTWRSVKVLDDVPTEGAELSVYRFEESPTIRLTMAGYHVEAGDGAAAWHVHQKIDLSVSDARTLRDFLSFLLLQQVAA